ncbi:MAG: hypothetical protein P8Y10_05230 [Gemmatimonadales bacterium]
MTRRLIGFLAFLALTPPACGGGGSPEGPAGPPSPAAEPRTYAMGWGLTPPEPTEESIIATAQAMAEVAEYAIIQQPVPWARLFAGEELDDLVAESEGLARFLEALGLEIVFLLDPLDGLDRTSEPPELVEAGRSMLEPEIRAIHEAYALAIAREVRPAYFGLASEINTLAAHGDPVLYGEMVDLINALSPQIRAIIPAVSLFVSFQVDDAWNLFPLPPPHIDHFALVNDFDIDALGLSSYPVFVWDSPADIPANYFSRFRDVTDLPLILVEGGWSSEDVGGLQGDEGEQSEFFRRFEELLDGVGSQLWVMLIFADFDVTTFGLPPEREATLALFASMGIVDSELEPKPSYAVWEEIFSRPLEP